MLQDPINKNDHIRGDKNSDIIILEYGDFECPYCAIAHSSISKLLNYFNNDLCYVFRNFPLTELHPNALIAAQTAEFASEHNQYWEMHDLIYTNQSALSYDLLFETVKLLKLSTNEFERAIENKKFLSKIKLDILSGQHNQVHGTPSFFINNERYEGPYDFDSLVEIIENLRGMKKASSY